MFNNQTPNNDILTAKEYIYDKCSFQFTGYLNEAESKEYGACSFKLNESFITSRNAKITPKKIGQFVTLWQRVKGGPIQPFKSTNQTDFFIINARNDNQFGQFVFPKSVLIKEGILSGTSKKGKLAMRVYPPWDKAINKQAVKTQKWQLEFFLTIDPDKLTHLSRAKTLYSKI
ncbi:MepB family protein [Leptospira sp. 'Mane']|uniref:MepB family protein n=1 Tax=Leptospira sp. 'Mane' TaxID=3387407 RepID=UPI00398B769F